MPRLVRRQPLLQRISSAFNPWDFLLWLSEEFETRELDSQAIGTQIGLVANFLFFLARANVGPDSGTEDDVFGDGSSRGWVSYLVQLLVWTGFFLSIANAVVVFSRKRRYRLFEAGIDKTPGTPSAHRVRVQSSPASNSPLRLLSDLVSFDTAESRAHPDGSRDVWELAVWDPRPASLALLSFFSPLHVLLYLFELPLDPLEPRPSVAVVKCLVLQVGLSALMRLLQSMNDQRQKDNAIVQKEVLHEYDTKFVQPRLHPVVRDVGTQASMDDAPSDAAARNAGWSVEAGTPTTLIRRSFQTHPNANYIKHVDPDYVGTPVPAAQQPGNNIAATSRLLTPVNKQPARHSDSFTPGYSSFARPRQSMPLGTTPVLSTSATTPALVASAATDTTHGPTPSASTNTNFGGSLGVYSHVNSPLKKTISLNDIGQSTSFHSPRNSRELAALEQREAAERMQRRASPTKETARATGGARAALYPQETSSPPVPLNPFTRAKPNAFRYERYPSRWLKEVHGKDGTGTGTGTGGGEPCYNSKFDYRRNSSYITSWNTPRDLPGITSTARQGFVSERLPFSASAIQRAVRPLPLPPLPLPPPPPLLHSARVCATKPSLNLDLGRPDTKIPTDEAASTHKLGAGQEIGALRCTENRDMNPVDVVHPNQSQVSTLFRLKKESHQRRRSLKESGDFLGVQGINPETGLLDVLTPTSSSNSTLARGVSPSLGSLAQKVKEAKEAYRTAKKAHAEELQRALTQRERDNIQKKEREKEAVRTEQNQVKWRKETGQWSSVAEPKLSPIAQSRSTTPLISANCLPVLSLSDIRRTPPKHARNICDQNHTGARNAVHFSESAKETSFASSSTIVHTPSLLHRQNSSTDLTVRSTGSASGAAAIFRNTVETAQQPAVLHTQHIEPPQAEFASNEERHLKPLAGCLGQLNATEGIHRQKAVTGLPKTPDGNNRSPSDDGQVLKGRRESNSSEEQSNTARAAAQPTLAYPEHTLTPCTAQPHHDNLTVPSQSPPPCGQVEGNTDTAQSGSIPPTERVVLSGTQVSLGLVSRSGKEAKEGKAGGTAAATPSRMNKPETPMGVAAATAQQDDTEAKSACTPITTITGSDPSPSPRVLSVNLDGTTEEKDHRQATVPPPPHWQRRRSQGAVPFSLQARSMRASSAPTLPNTRQSSWPKPSDPGRATPIDAILSSRQLTTTKTRIRQLLPTTTWSAAAAAAPPPPRIRAYNCSPEVAENPVHTRQCAPTNRRMRPAAPPGRSTTRLPQPGRMLRLEEAMAQGAAHMALAQAGICPPRAQAFYSQQAPRMAATEAARHCAQQRMRAQARQSLPSTQPNRAAVAKGDIESRSETNTNEKGRAKTDDNALRLDLFNNVVALVFATMSAY
ncbi:hypothetical protein SPI_00594 [Niveomyces insectorum RCEF 264]|uniref:Uncharacterized protein n=1 Tax=Niveomyces insectorum RCEF 264 TaxID=1081102 RepID=A0A162MQ83_9HYPO|nr:hypothetical protein SPI_00594 [Niveomyces insectorum RCEF 264]